MRFSSATCYLMIIWNGSLASWIVVAGKGLSVKDIGNLDGKGSKFLEV